MERDGITDTLQDVGVVVLANACGPCIGQVRFIYFLKTWPTSCHSGNEKIQKTKKMVSGPHIINIHIRNHVGGFIPAILTSFNR